MAWAEKRVREHFDIDGPRVHEYRCSRQSLMSLVLATFEAGARSRDSLGEFIAERCLIDPKATSPRSALFTAYRDWAEKAGYSRPLTSIGFGRQIGERPEVAGGASHGGRYWCGIRPWTALELATRMKAEGEAAAAEVAERVRKRAEEAGLTTVQGGLK